MTSPAMVAFGNQIGEGARVVLVIEADPQLASALQQFLQYAGFVVVCEQSVASALSLLGLLRPHAILFDRGAPGLDLPAFAHAVRSSRELLTAPRLLMTADRDLQLTEAAWVDEVLPRPFDTDRLVDLLTDHVQAVRQLTAPALASVGT